VASERKDIIKRVQQKINGLCAATATEKLDNARKSEQGDGIAIPHFPRTGAIGEHWFHMKNGFHRLPFDTEETSVISKLKNTSQDATSNVFPQVEKISNKKWCH
jgi:hypothetical protein